MGVPWLAGEARDKDDPGSISQRVDSLEAIPGLAVGEFYFK